MKKLRLIKCIVCDRPFCTIRHRVKYCSHCRKKYSYSQIYKKVQDRYNKSPNKVRSVVIASSSFKHDKKIKKLKQKYLLRWQLDEF